MVDPQEGGCALGRAGAGGHLESRSGWSVNVFQTFPQPKGGKGRAEFQRKAGCTLLWASLEGEGARERRRSRREPLFLCSLRFQPINVRVSPLSSAPLSPAASNPWARLRSQPVGVSRSLAYFAELEPPDQS